VLEGQERGGQWRETAQQTVPYKKKAKQKKQNKTKQNKQEFTKHWPGVQIQLSLFTLSLSSN